MFDFAVLDVLTGAEQGRKMELINPKAGTPFLLEDGRTPVHILLLGRASAIAKDTLKQMEDERAAIENQGRAFTNEMSEDQNTRYLAALTRGWNFTKLDGVDFPYTPENARTLWADPRWPYARRQALMFQAGDGNFLGASA